MKLSYLLTCMIVLSACTPQTAQEKARLACLNKADESTKLKKAGYERRYGTKRSHFVTDTEETTRLKKRCREMTSTYQSKE